MLNLNLTWLLAASGLAKGGRLQGPLWAATGNMSTLLDRTHSEALKRTGQSHHKGEGLLGG